MYISPDEYSTCVCEFLKYISKYSPHSILFNKTCEKLGGGNPEE